MNSETKKLKNGYKLLSFFSFLLTFTPVIIFTVIGFVKGSIGSKVTLGCMLICCLVLSIINFMMKIHLRSTIFLLLIGLYCCLGNMVPLLITIASCTIVDELCITPLKDKFKQRYTINKEIDRRENG